MNSVVEKLAAIEQEVAALQPKMTPLTERIAALDQKVTGFAQQLTDLAAESATVKQDIAFAQQSLARIQTLIGESKIDSEQLAAEQEENLQRYRAMESFVGTLYQLHSQSVQIAQWLGLADQAKAIFPAPPSMGDGRQQQGDGRRQTADGSGEPATMSSGILEESIEEESNTEPAPEEPACESEPPMPEEPPVVGSPVTESPTEELPIAESTLSKSDFTESDLDAAMSELTETEPEPWGGMPGLPDVSVPPDMEVFPSDSDADVEPSHAEPSNAGLSDTELSDTELSSEMASQLDVPPLNLAVPALPEQNEAEAMSEQEEQEIEDMLATMMAPVEVRS